MEIAQYLGNFEFMFGEKTSNSAKFFFKLIFFDINDDFLKILGRNFLNENSIKKFKCLAEIAESSTLSSKFFPFIISKFAYFKNADL